MRIDSQQLQQELDALAAISEQPAPVVTRVLFSEADLRARSFVKDLCRAAELTLREDAVGNLFARWIGTDPSLKPVATGSHIDAIPNAGRYDGVVGVLGAIEAIRALRRDGFRPRRSIELIVFTAEEPTRFGIGCLGSRLLSGNLAPERAEALRDRDGRTLEDWRAAAGLGEADLETVRLRRNCYSAFIELHIEQGPMLEQQDIPIGIVEKIAGPSSVKIELIGVGGHAGAVLMPDRHDALLAGAEIALAAERAALESGSPDSVATTGVFRIEPGAVNSVPCRVALEIDVRDTQLDSRDAMLNKIRAAAESIGQRRGVESKWERVNADPPATCYAPLVELLREVAAGLNLPAQVMISRAYHDSLFMAQICPASMIFIPCRGGVSHRPDEYSSPAQIANGVAVLAAALARLAN